MKKITLTLAIAAVAILSAKAQDGDRLFKRFKGDISIGYAAPAGSSYDGGALFAIEPKFAIMDKLAVGLRIEVAALAAVDNYSGTSDVSKIKAFASYAATADYYFLNNYSFRPFVGAGVGFLVLRRQMQIIQIAMLPLPLLNLAD